MVPTKRKHLASRLFLGKADPVVGFEPSDDFVSGGGSFEFELEVNTVHILRVQFQRGRPEIKIETLGPEEVICVSGMMSPEDRVPMLTDIRGGNESFDLADIVCPPNAQEARFFQIVIPINQSHGIDQGAKVMGVALTTCTKRSLPISSASSFMPLAYILPNPNSLPCAMNPFVLAR